MLTKLAEDPVSQHLMFVGLALMFERFGDIEGARESMVAGADALKKIAADNPRVVMRVVSLAERLAALGELDGALELLIPVIPPDPPSDPANSTMYRDMGDIALAKGDLELARSSSDRAISLMPHEARDRREYILTLRSRARILAQLADPAADVPLRSAVTILRQKKAESPSSLASVLHELGDVLSRLGRHAEAEIVLNEALDIRTQLFGVASPEARETSELIANIRTLVERGG